MCDLEDSRPHDSTFTSTTTPATESTPLLVTHVNHTYSIFTDRLLAAALASAYSLLSANIYFPALNSIAEDLKVTRSQTNLTITTYIVKLE